MIEEGVLKGSAFTLEEEKDKWIIGSDSETCQFVLNDSSLSPQHVLLSRIPEGVLIENLSQTNPAQINGEEMSLLPRLLEEGDLIQMGNEVLRYTSGGTEKALSHLNQTKKAEKSMPEETIQDNLKKSQPPPPPPQTDEEPSEPEETFLEDEGEAPTLAKINFGLIETGRWLLKVISGPNTGAEFYMEAGQSYLLGTDPHHCDVIFQDTSVSRRHARITITPEDTLFIEDLNSRNGVVIEDIRREGKEPLPINTIISLGTTSFAIYDREGEMHTIISPLLPSLLKSIQKPAKEQGKKEREESTHAAAVAAAPVEEKPLIAEPPRPKSSLNFTSFLIFLTIVGLFALAGFGLSSLFQTQPIELSQPQVNMDELIQGALEPFPALRYTFNPTNGHLLLVGHVQTPGEKDLLFSRLQGLSLSQSIKSIDDSGIVIDEYAWREVNAILAANPGWRQISIHSSKAGEFIVSGSLETRKQAEQLSNYLSLHFPYPNLLKQQIIVEEDVLNQVHRVLQKDHSLPVSAELKNGEVVLTGHLPEDQAAEIQKAIGEIKQIEGVQLVNNKIEFLTQAPEAGIINITDRYRVTGESRIGNQYTVVINERIVSEGDTLDGMQITQITPDHVFLENAEGQYQIDY